MAQTFLNEATDCEWLRDTHLKGIKAPEFHSFILEGNEDCPARLSLFVQRNPLYYETPIATYVLEPNTLTYRDETVQD